MSPRPPGWYTDSADPARERWWDGGEWSHVTRLGPQRPTPAARDGGRAGWRPAPPPGHGEYGAGPAGWPPPQAQQPLTGQYAGRYSAAGFHGPTTLDGVPLADAMLRLVARLVDYALTTVVSSVLGLPLLLPFAVELQDRLDQAVTSGRTVNLMSLVGDLYADPDLKRRIVEFQFLSLAVSALYCVLMIRLCGATVGKLMVGVRVRSWTHDGRPTWGQAITRWLTREGIQVIPVFGLIYWLVDSVWPLWDPRRQGLHDKLPGTVVVRAR